MIHVAVDEDSSDLTAVRYRTTTVDGLSIFYREAGDPSNPTLVLLHGFPSSSVMFRDLIPRLADRFHLIAPDYPGFGRSDSPPPSSFSYTFDRLGESSTDSSSSGGSHATTCTCKTTAARSGFAWRSRIPSEWRR